MQVTIELPDDIAEHLAARNGGGGPGALPRTVLEMVALERYRSGELTGAEVMRMLDLPHRTHVDAFLKQHRAYLDYTLEDLEQDRETHRRLGLR